MTLTDRMIKKAIAENKPSRLSDGNNLVLLIQPNGSKWWRFRYRYHGKAKMLSLGTYPGVSLKAAREMRDDAKKLLRGGIDPSQYRQEKKLAKTIAIENGFESVARQWWDNWKSSKTERHANYVIRRLEADIFPMIGNKPVTEITAPTLLGVIKKIELRGAMDIAKRALNTCGQIYRYAVGHGLAERNPATDIRASDVLKTTRSTNFARLDKKDLPEFLRKIEAYSGNPLTKFALQLMAFTFVRTNELFGARWEEIDWEARQWHIPAERMKMKKQHIVPLSNQAISVLQNIRKITGGLPLLFPNARNNRRPMNKNTILFAIYRLGYKGRMTGHGFRGIAATILREQQTPREHVELQLGHLVGNAVSRAYDYSEHLPERTKMMQKWADYLDELRQNKNTKK
ncbi:integrase arm-type DNA-binding domain-containing protein [Nitrosomonas sp. Nm34]|uniref:tyrosine-type recombinase/integrase n=1 Tax=Nitrosomonas sp. Nm34 TaxID=1881055 RepID=UPI0008F30A98|nr:integrase arm-type DNA-binding domain-containing protein [Nitrosomonas sp. Nm34]SFI39965.1 Integrase [Nitrosomonas sp. Nm34]